MWDWVVYVTKTFQNLHNKFFRDSECETKGLGVCMSAVFQPQALDNMVDAKICCRIWGICLVSMATKDLPAGSVLWSLKSNITAEMRGPERKTCFIFKLVLALQQNAVCHWSIRWSYLTTSHSNSLAIFKNLFLSLNTLLLLPPVMRRIQMVTVILKVFWLLTALKPWGQELLHMTPLLLCLRRLFLSFHISAEIPALGSSTRLKKSLFTSKILFFSQFWILGEVRWSGVPSSRPFKLTVQLLTHMYTCPFEKQRFLLSGNSCRSIYIFYPHNTSPFPFCS